MDVDELENARDVDDPKAAVIALLMTHEEASASEAADKALLQMELEGLRLKELMGSRSAL